LSAYSNVSLQRCDALKDDIGGGPFDCVVVYFLLSLLPCRMQDKLLRAVQRILKPGGLLVVADTKKPGDVPAQGLGRRQLQSRSSGGKAFTLYKEHFAGDSLADLLVKKGYETQASSRGTSVFSWAVGRSPTQAGNR
jgi:ubiquinone/menaquinone biosynthesis C-methylase UbiE